MDNKNTVPKFSIVMANFNGYETTKLAIDSMKKFTYTNFDIIVVDDCSTDDSIKQFEKNYPEIILIKSPQNGGLNKSYNLGIDHALRNGSEYVFTCQNDTYDYSSNMLEVILEEFEKDDKIGMVGPTIYDAEGNYRWNGVNKNKFGTLMNVSECFVIKKEVYQKIGLFNEKLVVYFEDIDLIIRLRNAGYKTSAVTNVDLIHSGHVTFNKQKFYPNYLRSRNVPFFLRRYIDKKKYRFIIRQMIAEEIPNIINKMGKSLKNNDIMGAYYTLAGFIGGSIMGMLLKWEEEKPWGPENTYPHYIK